jgi:Domain of unknown function (DUF4399)
VCKQIAVRASKLFMCVVAFFVCGATALGLALGFALAQERASGGPTTSPTGAEVYFVGLKDGATVATKLTVRFGLRGMGIAPAGEKRENTGHHHLLVDAELPPLDQPIANDANHLHFDAGQTEGEITLTAGTHTLQLLMGDKDHIPLIPLVMSPRIRVVATEGAAPSAAAPSAAAPSTAAPSTAAPAPATKGNRTPSPDMLRQMIPGGMERYLPDHLPDPRDFRR